MKRITSKIFAIALSLMLIIASLPVTALAAEETVINLAVADGGDIADAFNEAAKRSRDDKSGTVYRIVIPKGTYNVSTPMFIYSNTTVDMTSGAKLVNTNTDSSDTPMMRFSKKTEMAAANNGKGYYGYSAGGNIKLLGGTYDCNGLDRAVFKFGHISGVTIENVTMTNVNKKHYIEFAACENVTIKNCNILNFKGPYGGNSNIESIQIDAAVKEHFSGSANTSDETICRNVTITGCKFKNLKRGIGTHTTVATSYFTNMVFTNNTFENIEGYAIIASNYINSTISNNTIKNCGGGILFRSSDGSHSNFYEPRAKKYVKQTTYKDFNSKIENNTITVSTGYIKNFVNTGYGIQLFGEQFTAAESKSIRNKKGHNYVCPEGDFRMSGVKVNNNTINVNCTAYGIWLQGAAKNTISNNTITCNIIAKGSGGTGDGIRVESNSIKNTITNNKITNETAKGDKDKDMFGISILDGSNSNTISNNNISKPKKDGIKIEDSTSNVANANVIYGVGRDGFHLVNAGKTKVSMNTIKKSARDAVLAETSGSLKINDNVISKCRTAVNLKASKSAKIVANTSINCTADAIKLEKANGTLIDNNRLTLQKRDGVNVVKCKKVSITNNKITSSKRYGINASPTMLKKESKNKIKKSGKRPRKWIYK